jgi:crotonobetainyl-CoA:carnitine CoA-transferase CaiB-like acyl-CoA transferase
MSLPLQNIKVLDFSHLLPGELCSTILADLGCEVTRIESLQPGLAQKLPPIVKGESLYYWAVHRNKKRIGLDLKKDEAKEIVYKLVEQADIVVENFRPGVMSRLGVGYGKLHSINKGLIYCSISGYGHNSEFSQRPGHDLNLVAESGVLAHMAQEDDRPIVSSILVSDHTSALYGALSIVAALNERNRTGKGRHIDIGMFHSALSTLSILTTGLLYTGQEASEGTSVYRAQLANYNVYKCKDDRYLVVASLEPQFWQTFCERVERPDLIPKLPIGPSPEMKKVIADIIDKKTLAEWKVIFADSNCCVSPVNTLEEALEFVPTKEREMVIGVQHPTLGRIPQLRSPVDFPVPKTFDAPPNPPEGTPLVLKELGYSAADIQRLADANVIPQLVRA